jgi:hypothetical protein
MPQAYRKLEGKRPPGKHRDIRQDNIKSYLSKMLVGCDGEGWIQLAQDRDQC